MENLRLINNSGIQQEKNICFVNSSLQLLHSLPEVRNFLSNEEYKINEHINSPICNEMSSIFKTAGKFIASAATLRYLVGERSGNADINNGTQQDMTHFLRHLLHQIEIELSQCPGEASLFINKFWGQNFFINSLETVLMENVLNVELCQDKRTDPILNFWTSQIEMVFQGVLIFWG